MYQDQNKTVNEYKALFLKCKVCPSKNYTLSQLAIVPQYQWGHVAHAQLYVTSSSMWISQL